MINKVFLYFTAHKKEIFLSGTILEFVMIGILTLSLIIAFWLMGFPNSKWNFPMQIGVSAVVGICGGIGSLWALYKSIEDDNKAELEKYKMDSIFNSPRGEIIPSKKGVD